MDQPSPRETALRILRQAREGDYVEHLLETALAGSGLPTPDRHLCQELVYGIVRWQATLDWLIARKTNGRPQKPALQLILRLGLYQIFWLDRIPAHAAVNETVELARQHGFGPQSGFVNAVLRAYLREADSTRALLGELRKTQPAVGYSHPAWLVDRWQQQWGPESTARLLEWNNTPPNTYARVNVLRTTAEKLLPQWREENVDYDFFRADWLEDNLVFLLKSHPPLNSLPSFQQGLFYVQDPSTLLAPNQMDLQPGLAVLDLCAAPGGKLTYMAALVKNEGRLVAYDVAEKRVQQILENCARLGAEAKIIPPDAITSAGHFDRVLVDAPCSNTGVMRRRVDLRWRIRPEEIERLRKAQLELLGRAAEMLKDGGVLVYSTCSLEPEENENVIREFSVNHPWFELVNERSLLPFRDGVDGAYVVKLHRK